MQSRICKECNRLLILSFNKLYYYCPNHPLEIKYDDAAWNKFIEDENNKEWESLRRLDKD